MANEKSKMPSAYTTLFLITIFVAFLTWIIPAGKWNEDFTQYSEVASNPQGVWNVLAAPLEGFYQALDIILFVLVIGGMIGTVTATGAMDSGVSSLLKTMNGRDNLLIVILMLLFSLGGTTFGMAEELIAFFPILMPVFLVAGYDTMTVLLVIKFSATSGTIGSTLNPFATGVASGIAGISISEGLFSRIAIWILLTALSIVVTLRYANMVRKDIKKSIVYDTHEESKKELIKTSSSSDLTFTGKHKLILVIFALTFVVMILGVIPWDYKFNIPFFSDIYEYFANMPFVGDFLGLAPMDSDFYMKGNTGSAALGDWWFGQLSVLFFFSAMLIGFIAGQKEGDFVKTFLSGAKDLFGVACIIGISRGIKVIMTSGGMDATVLYWGSEALSNVSGVLLVIMAFLLYIPLSFLIPSSSGLAGMSMPVLAPLAVMLGVDPSIMVTAFQTANGIVSLITPTSGVLMGCLLLAKVPYSKWLKFMMPIIGIQTLIVLLVMIVDVLI